jgi:hypothetical protein
MLKPLGLPQGSVRALLLLGLFARAILDLRRAPHETPLWLGVALVVSVVAYFSSRSSARAGIAGTVPPEGAPRVRHPLFLPAGTIRTIVLVLVGYGAWLWFRHHDVRLGAVPTAWVLGAFALGVLVRWALGKARRPEDTGTGMFWHLEALVALACVGGLLAIALGQGPPDLPTWIEPLLGSVVVFYFGTR